MKKSVRFYIRGSIQPVFFNKFIKENADKLGVKGFLRHLEDGRVEIFIEGDLAKVDQMSAICKRGPEHSLIRDVEEKKEFYQGFDDFKVLRI